MKIFSQNEIISSINVIFHLFKPIMILIECLIEIETIKSN